MRYETIPRWTFVLLLVMGLGIATGAIAFLVFVPPPAGVIVGVIWLLIGGILTFFPMRAIRKAGADDRLRREGSAATATVLSAAKTHWTFNNVPQWAIRVRIDGLAAPYETTLKLLAYSGPADGARFGVRVDPLAHDRVVVAGDGDGGGDVERVAAEDDGDGRSGAAAAQTAAPAVDDGQAGLAEGEIAVVNADGSRTITMAPVAAEGDAGTADTARLLADLERLRASGSYSEAEYALVKAKLLGGDSPGG